MLIFSVKHAGIMNVNVKWVCLIFIIQYKWEQREKEIAFFPKFGPISRGCDGMRVCTHWLCIMYSKRCEGACISLSELLMYLFLKARWSWAAVLLPWCYSCQESHDQVRCGTVWLGGLMTAVVTETNCVCGLFQRGIETFVHDFIISVLWDTYLSLRY